MNYLWELTKEKEIKKRGETGNRQKKGKRSWGRNGKKRMGEKWREESRGEGVEERRAEAQWHGAAVARKYWDGII